VDPKAPLEKGVRYRSHYYFKFPYSQTVANVVSGVVHAAKGALRLQGINLISTLVRSPELTTQTAGGRYTRWQLTVEWEKV